MSVRTIKVADAAEAFNVLTELAVPHDNIIFRGHSDETWRLESTLARHVRGKMTELSIQWMSDTLDHFFACLAAIGKLPNRAMDARTQLEFARHYGVPFASHRFYSLAVRRSLDGLQRRSSVGAG